MGRQRTLPTSDGYSYLRCRAVRAVPLYIIQKVLASSGLSRIIQILRLAAGQRQ